MENIKYYLLIEARQGNTITDLGKEYTLKEDVYEAAEEFRNKFPRYGVVFSESVTTIVMCRCGHEVVCDSFTNTCENCDRDYNFAGQLLAPREQWGEETGEHWMDCY